MSLVSIPSILLLRTHLLGLLLTFCLILYLHAGGLSVLGLFVVDIVADFIVNQLLSLIQYPINATKQPHLTSVQTVLTIFTQSSFALMERVFTLTF